MTHLRCSPNHRANSNRHALLRNAVASAGLALCLAYGAPASTQPHWIVKIASEAPLGSPTARQLHALAEQISAATDGAIEPKLFPAGRLGGDRETIDKLSRGEVQVAFVDADALAGPVPAVALLASPGAFSDYRSVEHFFARTGRDALNQALAAGKLALIRGASWVYRSRFMATEGGRAESFWDLPIVPPTTVAETLEWAARGVSPMGSFGPEVSRFALRATPVRARLRGLDRRATHVQAHSTVMSSTMIVLSLPWYEGLPARLQAALDGLPRTPATQQVLARHELNATLLDRMVDRGLTLKAATTATREQLDSAKKVRRAVAKAAGHAGAAVLAALNRSGR